MIEIYYQMLVVNKVLWFIAWLLSDVSVQH